MKINSNFNNGNSNTAGQEWIKLGSMLDGARENYDNECYEEAIRQYEKILESDLLEYDDKATVLAELGYCYYELGDYKTAINNLQKAKDLEEAFIRNSGFFRIFGSCAFQLDNYEEAILLQKKALDLVTNSEERALILFQLGRSYLFSGNGKSAIKIFKEHLKLLPVDDTENRMDVMYNLGFAYIMLNKVKKAERAFQFLIDQNRNSDDLARGYYGLTELYYHTGKIRNVIDYGQKVLDIDDQFSERETILFYLILSFSKEGNVTQVNNLADAFLKEYPNSKFANKVKSLI